MQEFDFEYIYKQTDHSLKNLWVALANPESKDITSINGYLKLSISILNYDDPKIELIPMPNNDSDCMIPPQIELKYKQLSIYIFKGESFPDIKNRNNQNFEAFLECKYFNMTKTTKNAIMDKNQVQWNQVIELPINLPLVSEKIKFQVKSKYSNTDYLIGSFEIDIDDIIENKYKDLRCVNIYGAINIDGKSENDILMNENGEIGSRWKGRVYLKILYNNINSPISCVKDIEQKVIEETGNINRSHLWSFNVKLLWASFLPKKGAEYNFKVSIQENTESFGVKAYNLDKISWNTNKSFALQTYSGELDELPDLFLYLTDKEGNVISYQRLKLGRFNLKSDTYIMKLLPEISQNKYTSVCYSGVVKLRMRLFSRTKNKNEINDLNLFKEGDEEKTDLMGLQGALTGEKDLDEIDDLEELLNEDNKVNNNIFIPGEDNDKNDLSKAQNYKIVACVYMSRYLVSGDDNGLSDPYCEITIGGETRTTSVRKKCINGVWNEKLVFNSRFIFSEYSTWPLILIKAMDQDSESNESKNEILGYTYAFMNNKIVLNSTKN